MGSDADQFKFTLHGQVHDKDGRLRKMQQEQDEHDRLTRESLKEQVSAGYGSIFNPVVINGFEPSADVADLVDRRSVRELLREVADELWALRRERMMREYRELTAAWKGPR